MNDTTAEDPQASLENRFIDITKLYDTEIRLRRERLLEAEHIILLVRLALRGEVGQNEVENHLRLYESRGSFDGFELHLYKQAVKRSILHVDTMIALEKLIKQSCPPKQHESGKKIVQKRLSRAGRVSRRAQQNPRGRGEGG